MGLLGVWSTKVSIHSKGIPVVEWSDGQAPVLEALIRRRCGAFVNRGGSIGLAVAVITPTGSSIMTFGDADLSSDTAR